ncbi:HAD family hydrolase [Candidatus Tokpelaia sp.]|uniref:HAD family hydrolase n=1 Tax=Candidatus Tokpelaia sp. TaxID=2233777 RepID=UPI0012392793|nr:HAD family hydrolase [Candidatus Tokpelaia sp.]KAA6405688.1 haloacid dehalogenase-like hydrolase [Candidatus Tokpelaia sp.]
MTAPLNAAIAYDFDGTLIPGNMQDYSFFPSLGLKMPQEDFWPRVKAMAKKHDMDEILAYMHLMLKEAAYRDISLHRQQFAECGKSIAFFPGVEGWFDRINAYALSRNIALKHYIISSGLREMIEGTAIFKYFAYVYASGYMYNQDDVAIWPALAVNYTTKTQYIFRINKGVENSWDNHAVNRFVDEAERPVPTGNIMYLGDGETDIPAMKMIAHLGGHAITVYNEEDYKAKIASERLLKQGRAQYSAPADYTRGSLLDKHIQSLIDKIAAGEQ